MKESEEKEPSERIPTDAQTHSDMVESIAHRRPREEERRSPRFPTSECLSGDVVSQVPFGFIVCANKSADAVSNSAATSEGDFSSSGLRDSDAFEVISSFHAVDFSEVGMQIQFQCADPLNYSMKTLCLRIEKSIIPIGMQWFYQNREIVRAGISFKDEIDETPALSAVLVKLSDRLINFLTLRYITDNLPDFKEIAGFSYFCILSNLRLKYIQALSILNSTNRELQSYSVYNSLSRYLTKSAENDAGSKDMKLGPANEALETQEYKNACELFMKPFHEIGCSISGAEGRIVFLEKEVADIVSKCLLFAPVEAPYSLGLITQLQSVYDSFMILKELLPGVFQGEKYTHLFKYYSNLIGAAELSREALIDLLSQLGKGKSSFKTPDANFYARGNSPSSL
ncbi:MAG: hypothetical protein AB2L11_01925 [Syntrophobacteraceae bacterium]